MKKMLSAAMIVTILLIGTPNIFADQIVLKNGDRISGKIVKKDGDKIEIETEAAGLVSILWTAVDRIVADQNLNIKLADGQLIKGTVTPEDEKLAVTTKDAGEVTIEKEKIDVVRNDAEQLKFEEERDRLLNPGFGDLWTGTADVGLSLTTGNSRTRSFTAGVSAARTTTRDKISVYANAIYASNSTSGVSLTTANAIWAGGRYDYNINDKLFVYGAADFEHDSPQKLDLRSVFGGGLGYHFIRNEKTQLDLFGGGAYNMEYYQNGLRRHSAELVVGNELKHKFNSRVNATQRFALYPNVSHFGRFRAHFDASLVTSLNSWLGWHVTLADRFNSSPVLGAQKNDLLLSTGLRVKFGRKSD